MSDYPQFDGIDSVLAGYWEFFHDDSCGAVLNPYTKICSACGWRPDLQSMGARRTIKTSAFPFDPEKLSTPPNGREWQGYIEGRIRDGDEVVMTYHARFDSSLDLISAHQMLIAELTTLVERAKP